MDWRGRLETAARVGIRPAEFDEMTPAEFSAYVRGYIHERNAEQNAANHNVYNLANLIRQTILAKHMPEFDSVFRGSPEKKREPMTDAAMYKMVENLNRIFGGSVKE